MRKYWKWIIAAIALLLIGLLAWLLIDYFSVPRLPPWEKEKVEQEYLTYHAIFKGTTPIWYDENGHVEEEGVIRYIGTYGDCYAFLVIGDGRGAFWELQPGPFEVLGLSRPVYYPYDADIFLYHTKRTFTYTYGVDDEKEYTTRMHYFGSSKGTHRLEWLTEEQWEQLTRDIEKIAAEHD